MSSSFFVQLIIRAHNSFSSSFEIGGSKDALKLEEEALSQVMSRLVVVFRLQEVSIHLVVTRLLVGTRILG